MGKSTLGGRLAKAFAGEGLAVPDDGDVNRRIISTGTLSLDIVSGLGGVPEGQFFIQHGASGSGKTTAFMGMAAHVQSLGGIVIYLDWEQKLSLRYAKGIGVNLEDGFILNRPKIRTIEQGFEILEDVFEFIRGEEDGADIPILVIWDSMQSVTTQKEFKKDYTEGSWNSEASAYSRCFKRFIPALKESRAVVGFVSQVRMDVASPNPNAQTVGVGKASRHHAAFVLDWRKATGAAGKGVDGGSLASKMGGEGVNSEVICIKNQLTGIEGAKVKVPILHGTGIDHYTDTLWVGADLGIIDQAGAWYSIEGFGKWQGRAQFREAMRKDPAAFAAIRKHVLDEALREAE